MFKTSSKTSYKQQNPHFSTSYPQLGGYPLWLRDKTELSIFS